MITGAAGKRNRAIEPNIILYLQRETTAEKYEHGHWHGCRAAPSHERWTASLYRKQPLQKATFTESNLLMHTGKNAAIHHLASAKITVSNGAYT
jgi:hypothetical protein